MAEDHDDLNETRRLLEIMRALRDPQSGCPWDIEQDHRSLRKYVIEEAYEVVDAIDDGDDDALTGELGDLLLQVVFHAEIARGEERFDFEAIAKAISDKMIARHPHVFGDAPPRDREAQTRDWERIKAEERKNAGELSALDGVARALPALTRAYKLQKRAARLGFDWDALDDVRAKINEELDEIEAASPDERAAEFGDLLFAVVNFGRHMGIDPEEALALTNQKFTARFGYIETCAKANGQAIDALTLDEMEALWQESKAQE